MFLMLEPCLAVQLQCSNKNDNTMMVMKSNQKGGLDLPQLCHLVERLACKRLLCFIYLVVIMLERTSCPVANCTYQSTEMPEHKDAIMIIMCVHGADDNLPLYLSVTALTQGTTALLD